MGHWPKSPPSVHKIHWESGLAPPWWVQGVGLGQRKGTFLLLQTVLSRIFVYCHLESNSYYSPNVSRGHLPKGCTIDCSLIIPLSMVDHIIFSFCGYVWLETQFSQEDFEFFLECNCPLQLSPQIFSK